MARMHQRLPSISMGLYAHCSLLRPMHQTCAGSGALDEAVDAVARSRSADVRMCLRDRTDPNSCMRQSTVCIPPFFRTNAANASVACVELCRHGRLSLATC